STLDGSALGRFSTKSPVKAAPFARDNLVYVHTLDDRLIVFSALDRTAKSCWALGKGERCQ
ncbi:MAG: hypothetical protein FJ313_04470, partial [Gemmatimonadetes bacterium]|nr:hypothetical protein [Gemmatimonadota bacterium]